MNDWLLGRVVVVEKGNSTNISDLRIVFANKTISALPIEDTPGGRNALLSVGDDVRVGLNESGTGVQSVLGISF